MALIFTNPDGSFSSACAPCGQPLNRPIVATSHFIGDERNELHRFSDSAMHWECYAAWPQQRRFAAMHFTALVQGSESGSSQDYWPVLLRDDDSLLVKYGVVVHEISIALRTSGTDIRIPREEWVSFLASRWIEWSHHPLEHDALAAVMERLRQLRLPELPPGYGRD